ncbi:MAG: dephospho-CoA kinase [Alphaproteobacteria bacterium]
MLVIGLTGSIGMGKSTVAKRFIGNGIAVFDADAVVHELYEGEAVGQIEAAFPGSTRDSVVDRTHLAELLKKDKGALKRLEAIVHPMVREKRKKFLESQAKAGARMVVLEIPLLFETGGENQIDVTVVVSAPADVQRSRVLERPGMSEAKLNALLANQMPDKEKRRRADFVVDTDRSIEDTGKEIDKLIALLRAREDSGRH